LSRRGRRAAEPAARRPATRRDRGRRSASYRRGPILLRPRRRGDRRTRSPSRGIRERDRACRARARSTAPAARRAAMRRESEAAWNHYNLAIVKTLPLYVALTVALTWPLAAGVRSEERTLNSSHT